MSYIGNTPGVSSQRIVLEEVISGSPKSVFTPISGYIKGYVDVLINGHELDTNDFTANDGVTVTLVEAAAVGDTVKVKTWLPRGLSDGYLKTEADARFAALGSSYTKSEADAKYALIAASYTKSEADAKYALIAAAYTKSEADTKFATKANALFTGTAGFDATPASWWSGGKQLQLGAGTALWDYNAAGNCQTRLFNNLYLDASGTSRYLTSNNASFYQQYNGWHTFSSVPNGTAGAVATAVDVFSVDSVGNVKMNSGYGSLATAYGCRAWIVFNGVAQSIKASGNVSSISRVAQGQFEINMASSMPDTNYAVVVGGHNSDNGGGGATYPGWTNNNVYFWGWSNTVSQFRARIAWGNNANYDPYHLSLAVFR